MAIITVSVDEALETRFREAASKYFGPKKGNIGKAAEEAFLLWLDLKESCAVANADFSKVRTMAKMIIEKVSAVRNAPANSEKNEGDKA